MVGAGNEDGIRNAGLISLIARSCYIMVVLALLGDKSHTVSETNKRICYHIARTYWCATVSRAEVAASLLCPWLGDEEEAAGGEKRGSHACAVHRPQG